MENKNLIIELKKPIKKLKKINSPKETKKKKNNFSKDDEKLFKKYMEYDLSYKDRVFDDWRVDNIINDIKKSKFYNHELLSLSEPNNNCYDNNGFLSQYGKYVEEEYTKKQVQEFLYRICKDNYNFNLLDEEILGSIIKNKYLFLLTTYIFEDLKKFTDILNEKLVDICIEYSNIDLLEYLVEKIDLELDDAKFSLACQKSDKYILSFFMNKKFEIKSSHFCKVILRFKTINDPKKKFFGYRLKKKLREDEKKSKNNFGFLIGKEINDICEIKLFLDHGYQISQNDFELIIKNGLYLKDYKKYNLTITKNIQYICNEILFFPYDECKYDTKNFLENLKFLKFNYAKNIIKKYNLVFSLDDLKFLCNQKPCNPIIIKYIVENFSLVPNTDCLYSAILNSKSNKIIKFLLLKMNVLPKENIEMNILEEKEKNEKNIINKKEKFIFHEGKKFIFNGGTNKKNIKKLLQPLKKQK